MIKIFNLIIIFEKKHVPIHPQLRMIIINNNKNNKKHTEVFQRQNKCKYYECIETHTQVYKLGTRWEVEMHQAGQLLKEATV